MQPGLVIEGAVLAGVEDVKAGYPEGYGGGEEQDAGIERGAHGDPGRCGSDAEG